MLLNSCKKEVKKNDLLLKVEYQVDGKALYHDSLIYDHPAGYKYSITRIQYIISDLQFGGDDHLSPEVFFLDSRYPNKYLVHFYGIPEGRLQNLYFRIGLDSSKNISGSLPAVTEFQNMAWPASMGGGYHFIKIEGNYSDSSGIHGYAMHIGQNGFDIPITISSTWNSDAGMITLKMNVNEWFKNPEIYDFKTDGNYNMGNVNAMKKIQKNGSDIFN